MSHRGYRQTSRLDWGTDESAALGIDQINTGALLRIADAVEQMAQRHTELMRERDFWERRATEEERALKVERHRTASLRGHLKRAKRTGG